MNNKIKVLALQAGVEYTITKVMFLTGEEEIQKFAELIVAECVDIANNVHMCRDGRVVAEDIKQHFGFDEIDHYRGIPVSILRKAQEKCNHSNFVKTEHLTGEGAMEYVEWFDNVCSDCGKHWTTNN